MADVLTLPVSYTSVTDLLELVPEIGSLSAITSAQLFNFCGQAESLVNAKIVRNYSLPLASIPPLLNTLSTTIAGYYVFSRRLYVGAKQLENSPWPDRFKEAISTLEEIADGKLLLVGGNGAVLTTRTDIALAQSNTMNYIPTMSELDAPNNFIDTDKIDDLLDERNI